MRIIGFLLIALVLLSCGNDDEPDCSLVLPTPNWFELEIFDEQGNTLIGNQYQQEEFRLYNAAEEIFISPMTGGLPSRLQIVFDQINPNTDYFLELSPTDQDTLNFSFSSTQRPCFLDYNLNQVIYNGLTVESGGSYLVELTKLD